MKWLNVSDGKLAYDDVGAGPLIICVPSMGDLRGEYRFLTPMLVKAGYRVLTMDVRGHGESSVGWKDYSVAGVGSDIVALIREANAGPAIIIGCSMAGGAAVWAAAEAPEHVAGLVLIDAFVRDTEPRWRARLTYSLMFARPWGTAMWKMYFPNLYPTNKPADFTDYLQKLIANLREPGRLEALKQMMIASKGESARRLAKVQAPTLIIMGSKDPDFKDPTAEANTLAKTLKGGVHIIENAGHYPHAEMPDKVMPSITQFLQANVAKVRA